MPLPEVHPDPPGASYYPATMDSSRMSPHGTSGSKRDRHIGAIERYRQDRLAQALALLEREGSPLENVRSVVRFFERSDAEAPCRNGLVLGAIVAMCPHDAEIAELLRDTLERVRERIERSLHDAQVRGELAKGISPQLLSRALTSAMLGTLVTGYSGTLSMLDGAASEATA
jgi:AcrR family transcriptional regulator